MAIFITGDTHGDFTRFKKEIFYEQTELTKKDYTIICGDFGGVWDGSVEEQRWLDWMEKKPFTTLFVSGNHENFDLLVKYPVEEWCGGKVQRIRPSVLHLLRGQIYRIQGKTFFTMGGASSHDIDGGILEPDDPLFKKKRRRLDASGALYRVNHRSWWKEKLPSEEEYRAARTALESGLDGGLHHHPLRPHLGTECVEWRILQGRCLDRLLGRSSSAMPIRLPILWTLSHESCHTEEICSAVWADHQS